MTAISGIETEIFIKYPSGACFRVKGTWLGVIKIGKDIEAPMVKRNDGSVVVLDSRGIFREDDTRKLLYSPRDHIKTMISEFRKWMEDNPQWPSQEDMK